MLASARGVLRYRQTPRANTVRPYVPLPIGPVGRGLTPPRHLAFIAIFLFICRGRRPRRLVQFCLIAKFMFSRRGGFHSRPGSLAQPRNCKEGSRPLPTDRPYQRNNLAGRRGRRPLRPTCKLASTRCGRMQASAPTATAKPPLCKGRWHGEAVTEGL